MHPTCSRCRFWQRTHEESDVGDCRRYPPQASEIEATKGSPPSLSFFHGWPLTLASDWCGEFLHNVLPFVHNTQPSAN